MNKKRRPRTRQPEPRKSYHCDTSVIYYWLHAHSLHQDEVSRHRTLGELRVPRFVVGEYIRGYIAGLLELYFSISESQSTGDGVHAFISRQQFRHRRIANALSSACNWLSSGFDDANNPESACQRLADYLQECLWKVETEFAGVFDDDVRCQFGSIGLPDKCLSYDDILDLYSRCASIRDAPECNQCGFKESMFERLAGNGIDLCSEENRNRYSNHRGFVRQAADLANAQATPRRSPACRYCDQLSDTVISLLANEGDTILTGDKSSFVALGEILGVRVEIIPPLRELQARAEGTH